MKYCSYKASNGKKVKTGNLKIILGEDTFKNDLNSFPFSQKEDTHQNAQNLCTQFLVHNILLKTNRMYLWRSYSKNPS